MDYGAAAWLVMAMCSYQNFSGNACNTAAGAYWAGVNGQKTVDKLNKQYVDPIPATYKDTAGLLYIVYTQKISIGLYRGLKLEATPYSQTLNFSKSFP